MSTDKERIEHLEEAYRKLWEQHIALKEEIRQQYAEFKAVREQMGIPAAQSSIAQPTPEPTTPAAVQYITRTPSQPVASTPKKPVAQPGKSNWEQYVGEQLLSKIGIVILVIGVGIGAKYAIDHQLLSPVMRIMGGYLVAALLGFFAFRFREKYEGFSAILVSGAMAVTYFITYAAHIFYGLYPYWLTFVLLLLTTIGTVAAALRYNRVIIAHFGLVGAYVLPALIAAKTSHISNYFVYMAVINCGILVISFLRDWKSLFHVAFAWTTLVFVSWFFTQYDHAADQRTAIGFLVLFFVLFQAVALGYPLVKKHAFRGIDLFLVAPNMLSFFIMGQYVLSGETALGLHGDFIFGLAVAAFFYALWLVFRSLRAEDKLLQETHFVIATSALTLSFILELEGHSLPFILIIETCILGWLAIRSHWRFLDILATVLTLISGAAIVWNVGMMDYDPLTVAPFLNQAFLLSVTGVVLAAGTFAVFRRIFPETELEEYAIPNGLLLLALIGGFCVLGSEIIVYYKHLFAVYKAGDNGLNYGGQWLASMVMAMTAFTGLYWFLVVWLDRAVLHFRNAKAWIDTVSVILIAVLLLTATINVPAIFSIDDNVPKLELLYTVSRYIVFVSIAGMGWSWLRSSTKSQRLLTMIHVAILWMLSLEMTHWLTVNGNQNAHKLSLSILWGVYAIYILYLGIVRSFAALRVTAMIILGITLAKLFFYDITKLSTIAKTVLFMLLGGLMLVGAYFYQRYKAPDDNAQE